MPEQAQDLEEEAAEVVEVDQEVQVDEEEEEDLLRVEKIWINSWIALCLDLQTLARPSQREMMSIWLKLGVIVGVSTGKPSFEEDVQ